MEDVRKKLLLLPDFQFNRENSFLVLLLYIRNGKNEIIN